MLTGPGGVGKGTIVNRLLEADPRLWLSRSWTTRARRPGEPEDAYVFVDRPTFEAHAASGGFIEHAEFLDNLYGTPVPEAVPGRDVLLEFDVQGAAQLLDLEPGALHIHVVAPSVAEQERRLLNRGDAPELVRRRLDMAPDETAKATALGARVVVNDDLGRAVSEIQRLIAEAR
jgi:guanylate kinase